MDNINERLTRENMDKMAFYQMFYKESGRIEPVADKVLNYVARESFTLPDGVHVPKGTFLTWTPRAGGMAESQWREPEKFVPERFDPESEWYKRPDGGIRSAYAYAPLGFGTRICPGLALAVMETQVIIILFLTMFEGKWSIDETDHPEKVIIGFTSTQTIHIDLS